MDISLAKRKIISFSFLGLGFLGAVFILGRASLNEDTKKKVAEQSNPYSSAFLDINKLAKSNSFVEGFVESVLNTSEIDGYKYKIVNEEGKTTSYLLSKGELLEFAKGQGKVRVDGKIQKTLSDGITVFYVESVVFKQ